jgi:hypothetical protein
MLAAKSVDRECPMDSDIKFGSDLTGDERHPHESARQNEDFDPEPIF